MTQDIDGQMLVRWAAIHKTDRFIYIESLSGYRASFSIADGYKAYESPDSSNDSLGSALLNALKESRAIDPDENPEFFQAENIMKNYNLWKADMVEHYGAKSPSVVFKKMDYCFVKMRSGEIVIHPRRRVKPEYWCDLPPDKNVVIPTTADAEQAGAAVRLALSRC